MVNGALCVHILVHSTNVLVQVLPDSREPPSICTTDTEPIDLSVGQQAKNSVLGQTGRTFPRLRRSNNVKATTLKDTSDAE